MLACGPSKSHRPRSGTLLPQPLPDVSGGQGLRRSSSLREAGHSDGGSVNLGTCRSASGPVEEPPPAFRNPPAIPNSTNQPTSAKREPGGGGSREKTPQNIFSGGPQSGSRTLF